MTFNKGAIPIQATYTTQSNGGYALIATGTSATLTDSLGISLTAGNMKVVVNTLGIDPTTIQGLPETISTPSGPFP